MWQSLANVVDLALGVVDDVGDVRHVAELPAGIPMPRVVLELRQQVQEPEQAAVIRAARERARIVRSFGAATRI
ncbi:hypothetical protein ACFWSF_37615 [Streptomyces sp. NPDC058611]|uniref:hypothetical protein n=1 Tax=unclassified Streptomyces TaxID=2593676 RepID=UPI0036699B8E